MLVQVIGVFGQVVARVVGIHIRLSPSVFACLGVYVRAACRLCGLFCRLFDRLRAQPAQQLGLQLCARIVAQSQQLQGFVLEGGGGRGNHGARGSQMAQRVQSAQPTLNTAMGFGSEAAASL